MRLDQVDFENLLNADLVPYIALENSHTARLSTRALRVGMVEWHVCAANGRLLRITLEQRAWFYLGCIALFAQWAEAAPCGRFAAIGRYATLQEWMRCEIYGVFPHNLISTDRPMLLNFEAWIRGHLGAVLAEDVFAQAGEMDDCTSARLRADACGWDDVIAALINIVGTVETDEAYLNRPAADAYFPTSQEQADVRIRHDAQAWATNVFPEWVGRTVPLEAEPQVLATLQARLPEARFVEVEALACHGLALSLTLGATSWARARSLILDEFRRRCDRRDPETRPDDRPSLIAFIPDLTPVMSAAV